MIMLNVIPKRFEFKHKSLLGDLPSGLSHDEVSWNDRPATLALGSVETTHGYELL